MLHTGISETEVDHTFDRDWLALGACAIGLMFSIATVQLYSFGVFMVPISHEFGWTRGQLSTAVTAGQLSLVVSSLFWGVLLDRFGPRKTLISAVLGLGLGLVLYSRLEGPLWHLYAVFAALPMLAAAAAPLAYNGVLVRRFQRRLGLALGISLMGIGVGAALVPTIAQRIIATAGWRNAYVALAALALVVGLPAAWVATRHAKGPVTRVASHAAVMLLPLMRTRAFLLICGASFLLGTVGTGVLTHLVPMMTDHSLSPSIAARIAGLVGISTLVSRGAVGWLLDKLHAPYMLVGVSLICAAMCLLLTHGGGTGAYSLSAILLGLVVGAEIDFISFLLRMYFGTAAFGRLYAVAFAAFALGPGAALIGYSFDHFYTYVPGLLLFACFSVVAAILALAMPSYQHPEGRREPGMATRE